jgi:hypothetical protein
MLWREDGGGVKWLGLAQVKNKVRAVVNAAMKLRVLRIVVKLSSIYIAGGLLSRAHLHTVSFYIPESDFAIS